MSTVLEVELKELADILSRKEELHPDLVKCIEKGSHFDSLKHSLVMGLFYSPTMNSMYNAQYREKLKYVEKAKKEKNWSDYIWMHERPYRMSKFIEIKNDLSDQEYWSLLGQIWSDSENLWQYRSILNLLINEPRSERDAMMNEEEKKFMDKLPDEFTIYRGHQTRNKLGYSWSLSYWRAKWFAERFNQKRQGVAKATINKKDVVAVLLGRNEFEIIASPKKMNINRVEQKIKRPDWLENLKQEFEKTFSLSIGSRSHLSVHGKWHWEKVEKNALSLAKKTPKADGLVVQLFALIHDLKRENEDHDPKHGHRSALYAKELFEAGKLKISEEQLSMLMEACKHHNEGKVTEDPTIGVCWDADRMDLTRVGIITDPKLLSTKAGKELLWKI